MVAHRVEPHVRLHVQRRPSKDKGVEVSQQFRRGGRSVHRVRLALSVEGGPFDPEPGGSSAQFLDECIGKAIAVAVRVQLVLRVEVALVCRLQTFGNLVGFVAVGGEERAGQLRVPSFAVVALAVVLHDELPIRVLDEVTLRGHLRPGDVMPRQVRLDDLGHLVDVVRRGGTEADEDQPADDAEVHRAQREAGSVEAGSLDTGGDEFARRRVRPLVVAADDVAHRAGQVVEQPSAPVAADIVVGADLTVVIADDNDRVGADVDREIVAGLRHLGDRCDEYPGRGEDPFDIAREELRADVERCRQRIPGHAFVDEPVDIGPAVPARSSGRSKAVRAGIGPLLLWCQSQFVHHLVVMSRPRLVPAPSPAAARESVLLPPVSARGLLKKSESSSSETCNTIA